MLTRVTNHNRYTYRLVILHGIGIFPQRRLPWTYLPGGSTGHPPHPPPYLCQLSVTTRGLLVFLSSPKVNGVTYNVVLIKFILMSIMPCTSFFFIFFGRAVDFVILKRVNTTCSFIHSFIHSFIYLNQATRPIRRQTRT